MRARWYDTQAGVFTSVDPAVSSTNQPYQFANGDPVNNSDPSGLYTMGICATAQAAAGWGLGAGLTGTVCIVHTYGVQADEWGITETVGFTGIAVGAFAGASLVLQVSTAQHLVGLRGGFYNVTGSINGLACTPGVSANVFWGPTHRGNRVVGGDIGVGFGCGDGAAPFFTGTYVQVAHNQWAKGGLEAIWAVLAPETVPGNIASQLFDAAIHDSASHSQHHRHNC
ncbi:MAG: RHS repeat-associated core domain-containing protein [Acidimicrobiales bacterium]